MASHWDPDRNRYVRDCETLPDHAVVPTWQHQHQFFLRRELATGKPKEAVVWAVWSGGFAELHTWPWTAAGLAQDALSSGILGIGGLAKTVVGYLVGLASTQFIVAGPLPRFLTFLASTVIHAGIFIGLYELLNLRDFGFPWGGVLGQGVANALVGIVQNALGLAG